MFDDTMYKLLCLYNKGEIKYNDIPQRRIITPPSIGKPKIIYKIIGYCLETNRFSLLQQHNTSQFSSLVCRIESQRNRYNLQSIHDLLTNMTKSEILKLRDIVNSNIEHNPNNDEFKYDQYDIINRNKNSYSNSQVDSYDGIQLNTEDRSSRFHRLMSIRDTILNYDYSNNIEETHYEFPSIISKRLCDAVNIYSNTFNYHNHILPILTDTIDIKRYRDDNMSIIRCRVIIINYESDIESLRGRWIHRDGADGIVLRHDIRIMDEVYSIINKN